MGLGLRVYWAWALGLGFRNNICGLQLKRAEIHSMCVWRIAVFEGHMGVLSQGNLGEPYNLHDFEPLNR